MFVLGYLLPLFRNTRLKQFLPMTSHPSDHLGRNSHSIAQLPFLFLLSIQTISKPCLFFFPPSLESNYFLSCLSLLPQVVLSWIRAIDSQLLGPHHPLPATVNVQPRSLVMLKYMLDRITLLSQHDWRVLCLAVMELWELDLLHHEQEKKKPLTKKVVFKY